MSEHPKIDNAPGVVWRPLRNGWQCIWQCRTKLRKRGYLPKSVRLWAGDPNTMDELDIEHIQKTANTLQNEMKVWGRQGEETRVADYDGLVSSLIYFYQNDADSPYYKLRYRTRLHYDSLMEALASVCGREVVSEIKARHVLRYYERWSAEGKTAMGHAVIGMLRMLAGFGATILDDADCMRLSLMLSKMKFANARPRTERLTAQQVELIRAKAHQNDRPSVALAQAFQFECILRQKDVIGEWVPNEENGPPTDVIDGPQKWWRGLRWEEIDANLVLTHVTSKRQKPITVDLKNAPMVMEELALTYGHGFTRSTLPGSGPIIVSELTRLPYGQTPFQWYWRKLATECGIPKHVRNMDTRAGAISEATDAGAELEHVRQAATHSDIGMTQRYSRNDTEKIVSVQMKRVAHRNKPGS